ncbi:hypothetical protein ACWCYK_08850 [Streptomyces lydicamycinicus]|uniref:Uncharacterized protein n=1 Tax=Streptomyces mooreae TaxID=3075523 RepID=A0ABU2T2T7_9ACTN|nr:hypothetical protein [Streptomyces sp. DSM 41527]MDT0455547.1 hypothetical protein [Streptomyces sp. DSM 41527]
MPLKRSMPTRDPEKARPEDVREYSARDGGWTRDPSTRPVPGTPKGAR